LSGVVLVIAGHDPSGGAGIQADARVIESFGLSVVTVPTALTVQSSRGVVSIHPVDVSIIRAQLELLFDDIGHFDAVKVAMLPGAAHVELVSEILRSRNAENVVVDPVVAPTHGPALLDRAGIDSLLKHLVPLATVVTPNLPELELLGGLEVLRGADVLVKGGHATGDESVDTLYLRDGRSIAHRTKRLDVDAHGTGCFLSSAIAANLARGYALEESVGIAKRAMTAALRQIVVVGSGRGYPSPHPSVEGRLEKLRGIYLVTDETLRPERTHLEITEAALAGGASVVQLRDKQMGMAKLMRVAQDLRIVTRKAGALLIINDRVDLALAAGADGIHLGPDDMHPADARRLLGPHALIGVSVSSVAEAEKLAPYASYFGVGAIFGTATKADAGDAVGPAAIAAIKARFPEHRIVAIGGINRTNLSQVIAAGADAAAVVSAIVAAEDMTAATRELVRGM
jgi:thiamine-phosphate diphosphorylase/hydroxymethylpyrimidine kinase/phosphomethylpyrimidine kinase